MRQTYSNNSEDFFEDPILDAKAGNVEYKDSVEEEWESFNRDKISGLFIHKCNN